METYATRIEVSADPISGDWCIRDRLSGRPPSISPY